MISSDILEVTEEFIQFNPLFYTAWMLGTPVIVNNESVPTAAVAFNKEGTAVEYLFNESFWNTLTPYERAFVFAHETLHVFLNHGKRGMTSTEVDIVILNIAMDVVINESLLSDFKFDRTRLPKLTSTIYFFDTIFKNPTYFNPPLDDSHRNKSVEYYYNLLKNISDDKLNYLIGDESMFILGNSIESMCDENNMDTIKEMIKDSVGAKLTEEERKELEDIAKKSLQHGKFAGTDAGSGFIDYSYIKVKKVLTWKQLIKKITNFSYAMKDVDRWMPRNRRVHHIKNELFLPSVIEDEYHDKIKPQLFVFLDTSGSCYDISEKFYKALQSIPLDHFIIKAFGFSTSVYEIQNGRLLDFGGTNFSIIENKIQHLINSTHIRYPDLVFVITDGYGTHVSPKYPKRWHWFLSEYSCKTYIPKNSNSYKLSEFYDA